MTVDGLAACHAFVAIGSRRSGSPCECRRHARCGRRAGAQVEPAARRRMERSVATPPTAAALSSWTTASSHDEERGATATGDCASYSPPARSASTS
jgi:hypothetical protein